MNEAKEIYAFGPFRLYPSERVLRRDGEAVPLEPKVFDTLLVLVRGGGRLVGKAELMKAVWPDSFVEEGNLARNVSVLRKALNGGTAGTAYIETVPKFGYRFRGEPGAFRGEPGAAVEPGADAVPAPSPLGSAKPGVTSPGAPAPVDAAVSWRPRSPSWLTALVPVVVLVGGLYMGWFRPAGAATGSLAVAPFQTLAGSSDTQYLAASVTDGIVTGLRRWEGLTIIPLAGDSRRAGRRDPLEVGRTVGARAVLAGRVAAAPAGMVSIEAELLDARDGRRLWNKRQERALSDLQAVLSELSAEVAERFGARREAAGAAAIPRGPERADAYELYLKGRYHLNTLTDEGLERGFEYLRRAVEKDPTYGPAHAGLAEYYALIASEGTTAPIPPAEAFPRAKAAALRALALDPTLGNAHTALGMVAMDFEWDAAAAERDFRRALALNPNYVNAHHWYSHLLIGLGRFEESLAASRRALALDPLDVPLNFHLGFHYYFAREHDLAIGQLTKTLTMDPRSGQTRGILGLAYSAKGRHAEAVAELEESVRLGGLDVRGSLGYVYAVAGRRGDARRLLEVLGAESGQGHVSEYDLAGIYLSLGEPQEALACLERAVEQRANRVRTLKVDPIFDRLRGDPQFEKLLRRVGLVP